MGDWDYETFEWPLRIGECLSFKDDVHEFVICFECSREPAVDRELTHLESLLYLENEGEPRW